MSELTQAKLWEFIQLGDEDFDLEHLRGRLKISPESSVFYTAIHRLMAERKIKRMGRGKYRRVKPIEPVVWWDDSINEDPIDFYFPRSHDDETEFGIEDCVEIFPGDMILIGGVSNYGKTALALSLLAENISLMPAVLMGSEYTAADGKITPKFKRRMRRMNWIDWVQDGKPRFELYPVGSDYEDYVKADCLNIIDWISLPGEYYMIDNIMKSIKDRLGNGIGVIVLQKNRSSEYAEGGERTERYADVYLKIDPFGKTQSMLTLGKVKAPRGRASGRMWAFDIVDSGANLHNIREIRKCEKCFGKGYVRDGQNNKRCPECEGLKYVEI